MLTLKTQTLYILLMETIGSPQFFKRIFKLPLIFIVKDIKKAERFSSCFFIN